MYAKKRGVCRSDQPANVDLESTRVLEQLLSLKLSARRFRAWPAALGVFEDEVESLQRNKVCVRMSCRSVAGEVWVFSNGVELLADEVLDQGHPLAALST